MANETPIETETLLRRFTITASVEDDVKNESDNLGSLGYLMRGCFQYQDQLVVVYQLTR